MDIFIDKKKNLPSVRCLYCTPARSLHSIQRLLHPQQTRTILCDLTKMGKTFNQQTISSVPSCSFDNRLIDLNLQINLYCRTKHLKKCQAVSMAYLKD